MVQITRLHNTCSVHQVTQTMKSNPHTTDKRKLPSAHHHWNIPRLKFISIRNYLIYFGEFFNIMTFDYTQFKLKKHIIYLDQFSNKRYNPYLFCATQLIITAIKSCYQSCIKQIYLLLANDKKLLIASSNKLPLLSF